MIPNIASKSREEFQKVGQKLLLTSWENLQRIFCKKNTKAITKQ